MHFCFILLTAICPNFRIAREKGDEDMLALEAEEERMRMEREEEERVEREAAERIEKERSERVAAEQAKRQVTLFFMNCVASAWCKCRDARRKFFLEDKSVKGWLWCDCVDC
jgi:hypothetical protein